MQPFWFPSVLADGTLVACEQDFNASMPMGTVGDGQNFTDLWRGSRAAAVRRMLRDTSPDLLFCRNCPAAERATTDTSVWSDSVTGRPLEPVIIASDAHAN